QQPDSRDSVHSSESSSYTILRSIVICMFFVLFSFFFSFFFFNDTAPTEIYTLSLHDALPISLVRVVGRIEARDEPRAGPLDPERDRKSTRLNSSHVSISYAVFCLKKKKNIKDLNCILPHLVLRIISPAVCPSLSVSV